MTTGSSGDCLKPPTPTIADALTHQLVLDSATRQTILESSDAAERVELLTETLTIQLATLGGFQPSENN